MALATQYVDDNPLTQPTKPGGAIVISPFVNQQQLLKYHFTLWSKDAKGNLVYGQDANINNPDSQQLRDPYGYSVEGQAPGVCLTSTNKRLQFMGEYLHAFEDTFAHRDEDNVPYKPFNFLGMGAGHLMGGHNPDYTYDHEGACSSTGGEDPVTTCVQWDRNQDRTLEMERETYQKIIDYMTATNYGKIPGQNGKKTDFSSLDEILKDFNKVKENSDNTGDFTKSDLDKGKLAKLEDWLDVKKYRNADGSKIELTLGEQGYNQGVAKQNRADYLKGSDPAQYPSAIMPPAG